MSSNEETDKEILVNEMVTKQRTHVPLNRRLCFKDIQRIAKHICNSIFYSNDCVIWQGYITNLNKREKGSYINFFFKKKKEALHRLIYENFVGTMSNKNFIKFNCENKGICCNINHMEKFVKKRYIRSNSIDASGGENDASPKKMKKQNSFSSSSSSPDLKMDFGKF